MEIQIRPVTLDDLKIVGEMFTAHLMEQNSIDKYAAPNPAFDPALFIEAMMNPPVNRILLPIADGKIVGFARLGVLYGEGLLPLGGKPKRTKSNYIKRLPVIILGKIRGIIDRIIMKFETRKTISVMGLPVRRGYIADFYLEPRYRQKGIGTALCRASIEWFASVGIQTVDLMYISANEPGKKFWKKMGFPDYRVVARKTI